MPLDRANCHAMLIDKRDNGVAALSSDAREAQRAFVEKHAPKFD